MVTDDDRLGRIERKLDNVENAIVSLARMEERMLILFQRMDTYDSAQAHITERLSEMERLLIKRTVTVSLGEKLVWLMLGAALSYVGWASKGVIS